MTDARTRLALSLDDPALLTRVRQVPPVDALLLRFSLIDPPRASGATKLAQRLRETCPDAELVPYLWHLISHGPRDGLRGQGTRTLAGPDHAFGELKDTPQVEQALDAALVSAEAFGATRVVLRTAASITPGPVGRKRLAAFVQRLQARGFSMMWEPAGLWEAGESRLLAQELGITLLWPGISGGMVDFQAPVGAWLSVGGAGRAARLRPEHVADLLELWEEDHCLVLTGPNAVANLRALLAG